MEFKRLRAIATETCKTLKDHDVVDVEVFFTLWRTLHGRKIVLSLENGQLKLMRVETSHRGWQMSGNLEGCGENIILSI